MDSVAVHYGLGRHSFYLTEDQITSATKFNYFAIPFNLLSSTLAKTSICFFLLHVNQNKKSALFLYTMITIMLTLTAAACILLFAQCKPIYALWTGSLFFTNCLPPIINAHFGLSQSSTFTCILCWGSLLTTNSFYGHCGCHFRIISLNVPCTYHFHPREKLSELKFLWALSPS
jgi:hypothetical protein